MTTARAFRGFRFPAEVILWAVCWYLLFPTSYRDHLRADAHRHAQVWVPLTQAAELLPRRLDLVQDLAHELARLLPWN
jgi:hypothetical protein